MELDNLQIQYKIPERTQYGDIPLAILWRFVCALRPDKACSGHYLDWYDQTVESELFSIFGQIFNSNPSNKDIKNDSYRFGFEMFKTLKIKSSYPKLDISIPGARGYYNVTIPRRI